MSRPPQPMFLERQSYRRRRRGDAARLLPLVGAVLLLLPVLWSDAARTAGGLVYVFLVWAILIALAAVLSRALSKTEPNPTAPDRVDPDRLDI